MANITQVVENIAYGTASLYGTASWALNSKTASYISSSNIIGNVTALSASWASSSLSSSYPWFTTGSNIAYVGGNVGIGTTSPAQKLHIESSTSATSQLLIRNTAIAFGSGYSSALLFAPISSFGGTTEALSGASIKSITSDNYSTDLLFSNFDQNRGTFAESMRITSIGNVAIGTTTSSGQQVTINSNQGGVGNAALKIIYNNSSVLGEVAVLAHRTTGWSSLYVSGSGVSLVNAVFVEGDKPVILNAGNVGIGTTTPNNKLEVNGNLYVGGGSGGSGTATQSGFQDTYGGIRSALFLRNSADYAASRGTGIDFQSGAGVAKTRIYSQALDANQDGYYMAFATTPTGGTIGEKMRLSATGGLSLGTYTGTDPGAGSMIISGNVGIGTISPVNRLDVVGNISCSVITASLFNGIATNISGGVANYIPIWASGTTLSSSNIYQTGGNVGIGTTSPGQKLSVAGGTMTFSAGGLSNPAVGIGNTQAAAQAELAGFYTYDSSSGYQGWIGGIAVGGEAGGWGAKTLRFQVPDGSGNPVNALNILGGNGYVGIGTTAPGATLDVSAFSSIRGPEIRLTDRTVIAAARNWVIGNAVGNLSYGSFGISYGSSQGATPDANTALAILNNGNVGIGTTSPATKLHISGATGVASSMLLTDTTDSAEMVFRPVSGGGLIAVTDPKDILFGTYSTPSGLSGYTQNMVIKGSGNVGIGTTSPRAKLHVSTGSIQLEENYGINWLVSGTTRRMLAYAGSNIYFGSIDNDIATNNYYRAGSTGVHIFETNGGEKMRITNTGNVGIGTDTPGGGLDVRVVGAGIATQKTADSVRLGSSASGRSSIWLDTSNTTYTWRAWFIENYLGDLNIGRPSLTVMTLLNGGNVGIGTTSPQALTSLSGLIGAPGITDKGILQIYTDATTHPGSAVNVGLSIGGYLAYPYGMWIQSMDSRANQNTAYPIILNPLGGNVGIGTTSPGSSLHVYSAGTTAFIQVDTIAANTSQFRLLKDNVLKWAIYSPAGSNDLRFYDAADRVTIQSGGNVGIGTTTPEALLTLSKDADIAIRFNTTSAVTVARNWAIDASRLAYGDLAVMQSTALGGDPLAAGTARMYFDYSGYVGIGTTSPESLLHISGGAVDISPGANGNYNEGIRIHPANNDYSTIVIGAVSGANGSGTGQWNFLRYPAANGNMFSILHNAANVMTMTTGSNIGIGTTTPVAKLDVNGTINSGTGHIYLSRNLTDLSARRNWGFVTEQDTVGDFSIRESTSNVNDPASSRLTILSGGNVGIGTTSPGAKLEVNGSINAKTAGSNIISSTVSGTGVYASVQTAADTAGLYQCTFGSTYGGTLYGGVTGNNQVVSEVQGASSYYFGTVGTAPIYFAPQRSIAMTILNNGNVGIGTISPVNRLDVVGNISCSVITASLFFGTASRATNALTAAYVSNTGVVIDTTGMNVNNATTYGVTGINFSSGITYVSSSGIIFTSGNSYKDGAATASLFGTASWALNAKTASYISSTNISGNVTAFSASWASSSLSSSYPWLTTADNISYVGGNVGIGVSAFGSTAEKLLVSGTTYNVISGVGTLDNYLQLNIKNSSAGVAASSDIVATNNTGNETGNFVDLGINSSGYTSNVVGLQNDGYLYNTGSNFYIGNITTGKNLYLFAGGTADTASVIINSSKNVGIGTISPVNKLDVFGNISCSIITASLFYGTASRATTATTALSSSTGVSSDSTDYNLTMVAGSGNQPLLADTHPSLVWNPGTTGVGLLKVGGLLNLRDPNSTTVLYRDTYIEDAGGAIRFTTSGSTYTTFGVTGNITIPVTAKLVGTSSWAVSASWAPSVAASLYVTGAIYASSSISASWASSSLYSIGAIYASSSISASWASSSLYSIGAIYASSSISASWASSSLYSIGAIYASSSISASWASASISSSYPWRAIGTDVSYMGGNVGIGTTTPIGADSTNRTFQIGDRFVIQSTVGNQTTIANNAYYDGGWKKIVTGASTAVRLNGLGTAGDITFTTSASAAGGTAMNNWDSTDIKMTILNGGNVGIGLANPGAKLQVAGNIRLPNAGGYLEWLDAGGGANIGFYASVNDLAFYTAGTNRMQIDTAGGVSIGNDTYVTTTPPSNGLIISGAVGIGSLAPVNKLDVVGNISCSVITASLFYGTASRAVSSSFAITASYASNAASSTPSNVYTLVNNSAQTQSVNFTMPYIAVTAGAGNLYFITSSNRTAVSSTVIYVSASYSRLLRWNEDWQYLTQPHPNSLAADESLIASFTCFGTNETDVIVAIAVTV